MKQEDFQKLVKELQGVDVQLPLHKQALRERILAVQSQRAAGRRSRAVIQARLLRIRKSITSKRALSIGAAIAVVGILLVGLLILLPISSQQPAKRLIAEAAVKVEQMNPKKVAQINDEYKKDLDTCLKDASASDDLRVAADPEVDKMIDPKIKQEHAAETDVYVTYTDPDKKTVVIALNTDSEPVFAMDAQATLNAEDDKRAEKEAKKASKQEEKALKKVLKQAKKLGVEQLVQLN